MNIHRLSHGWTNKYYWFDITNKIQQGDNIQSKITSGEIVFSHQSGTTSTACHGTSSTDTVFSESVIQNLPVN